MVYDNSFDFKNCLNVQYLSLKRNEEGNSIFYLLHIIPDLFYFQRLTKRTIFFLMLMLSSVMVMCGLFSLSYSVFKKDC